MRVSEAIHHPHELNLEGMSKSNRFYVAMAFSEKMQRFGTDFCLHSGNSIRDEGAPALGECRKQNTTLTQLNLECMSIKWLLCRDGIQRENVRMFWH
jgi:hypothetical protein